MHTHTRRSWTTEGSILRDEPYYQHNTPELFHVEAFFSSSINGGKPDFRFYKMKMTVGLKRAPSHLVADNRIDK